MIGRRLDRLKMQAGCEERSGEESREERGELYGQKKCIDRIEWDGCALLRYGMVSMVERHGKRFRWRSFTGAAAGSNGDEVQDSDACVGCVWVNVISGTYFAVADDTEGDGEAAWRERV